MDSIVIQSSMNEVLRIEDFVSNICDEKNIANYFATISVPVVHAVRNAIQHGNLCNPDKMVYVEAGNCPGGVYFTIQDEGAGFDFSQYGAFPSDDCSGEGIFIIKTLSDRMEYSDGGRTLRLEFDINGIESSDALSRKSVVENFFLPKDVEVSR